MFRKPCLLSSSLSSFNHTSSQFASKTFVSSRHASYDVSVAKFNEFGSPQRVLKVEQEKFAANLTGSQVLLRVLAAPVHSGDLAFVQGSLRVGKGVPATPGFECVAQVLELGPSATSFKKNERVTILPTLGTWKTHLVCDEKDLKRVDKSLETPQASFSTIDPLTAFCLLQEFVKLNSGDVVLQVGGDTSVGLFVSQLASSFGVKVISVVGSEEGKAKAQKAGAALVVDEKSFGSVKYSQLASSLPKPKLALNPVSGPLATHLARQLADGGVLVTYGNSSHLHLQVPPSHLIFRNISLRGFSVLDWLETQSTQERNAVLDQLNAFLTKNPVTVPTQVFPFTTQGLSSALAQHSSHQSAKIVLSME